MGSIEWLVAGPNKNLYTVQERLLGDILLGREEGGGRREEGGGRREEGVIKPPSTDDNIDFSKI
jgi:hypothetical protein